MVTLGIDPGMHTTGVAVFDGKQFTMTASLRGARGVRNDYERAARAVLRMAGELRDVLAEHDPDLVAVETFVDQGGQRNRMTYRWQTPLVIGGFMDALDAYRVVWQDATDVLAMRAGGYGRVKYLAEQGRLGHGLVDVVNEHEASAVAHAMHADAADRHLRLTGVEM